MATTAIYLAFNFSFKESLYFFYKAMTALDYIARLYSTRNERLRINAAQ